MAVMLDRPPADVHPSPPRRSVPPAACAPESPPRPTRSGWRRYQQHLWMTGLTGVVVGAMLIPAVFAPKPAAVARTTGRPDAQTTSLAPATLDTNVTFAASEFKFSPTSVQVPLGEKVRFTLNNTGVVEHDLTISAAGFTLRARPGQSATGEFTFQNAGTFDFICSIPGHKDAGMKGSLTVVDPTAASASVAESTSHDMAGMAGMAMTSTASGADVKPLPADLKPLPAPQFAPPINRTEPAYVKFDLTTQKVTAQLADGVAYDYWTFNGTVPGPMLRVREGDTVEINLRNAPDSGVTHSIDLHAVTGPGGGATVTQVAPGDDASFRFQALNPGVYVYHCATPMVAHHIASGMYGLIVVEPRQGLPKVDHEYYLMQGDFYLQGNRGDQGLRAFDLNKMLDERPDYVLFNGAVGSHTGDNAFKARVGETVRIFFGVGGPNLTSSFHVIGEVLDRVYPEGALANPLTDVQTTHVPTGGATVAEFKLLVPGTYSIVDHSLGRLEKGAAAQIRVEGPEQPQIFEPIKRGAAGTGGH
jgi:nitrite reductase (NO-forming)